MNKALAQNVDEGECFVGIQIDRGLQAMHSFLAG